MVRSTYWTEHGGLLQRFAAGAPRPVRRLRSVGDGCQRVPYAALRGGRTGSSGSCGLVASCVAPYHSVVAACTLQMVNFFSGGCYESRYRYR